MGVVISVDSTDVLQEKELATVIMNSLCDDEYEKADVVEIDVNSVEILMVNDDTIKL